MRWLHRNWRPVFQNPKAAGALGEIGGIGTPDNRQSVKIDTELNENWVIDPPLVSGGKWCRHRRDGQESSDLSKPFVALAGRFALALAGGLGGERWT